ncbi:metallophosphoesterase family protein [Nocardia goodfellowii]|uniref:Phosphodiesterase n=1 Tax=Nocardia goodfellowii TaxID=882446 RepID=A0ABS4Q619_9NOCA|nr:metallophosphoesterase [Nocardia goodfellowii]MBP2187131.1 putative phosphodiesterase [Nocardia goodfellowii]
MTCCGPSRRTFLGAVGLTALLSATGAGGTSPARAQWNPLVATDLEVVTVTDTSVVLTWTTGTPHPVGLLPAEAGGEVRIGPADSPRAPVLVHADAERTPFHYAEIHGLEPGRTYRFEVWSDGVRATPGLNPATVIPGTPEATGEFTTLVPPPGRLVRTLALANDVHYGETVSGVVVGQFPPGFRQAPDLPPYPEVMLSALLDDLRAPDRGAQRLLLAGDLTAEATPAEVNGVRRALDGWGRQGRDYLAVRGNHDRPHIGDDYRSCSALGDHFDCWGPQFNGRQQLIADEIGGLRVIGLDTSQLDASGGRIERPQFERLAELLRTEPDQPTLVFGHHPVTRESGYSNIAGPGFILDQADSAELQALYARSPGVFLQHSGHTHRNRRTRPDTDCAVEFLEVAAVKEYPGGYSLLRLYEGGYMVNFYKTRTAAARRWSGVTRGEFLGLQPFYTLGTCADRNHVVLRDFSGVARITA